jgi:sigma-B regulation protein RsbU (phosphoserine phosphatase)
MNGLLRRGLPTDVFVAALIAVVDMKTAECRVTNAGLPHPFVLRRGAGETERVAANGFMLGIIDDELYHPEEATVVQLGRNDLLLLYTDGIGEVENADGEHFDTAGLCETLLANAATSAADLAGALINECRRHSRAGHEWDDITMVGIELE